MPATWVSRQGEAADIAKLGMIFKGLPQPIAGDPARQVIDVMDADVGREPAQHSRQVVMGGALQGAAVEARHRADLARISHQFNDKRLPVMA